LLFIGALLLAFWLSQKQVYVLFYLDGPACPRQAVQNHCLMSCGTTTVDICKAGTFGAERLVTAQLSQLRLGVFALWFPSFNFLS